MIAVCWAGENLEGLLKFLTFIELASANMFAITNLAICVNLALIVMVRTLLSQQVQSKRDMFWARLSLALLHW